MAVELGLAPKYQVSGPKEGLGEPDGFEAVKVNIDKIVGRRSEKEPDIVRHSEVGRLIGQGGVAGITRNL
jgi:hypothetical protein